MSDQHHPGYDCTQLSTGLFTLPAEAIAESLASPHVSPNWPASGLRLLTFYINYAGKRLSVSRKKNLEKAKKLLMDRITHDVVARERGLQRKAA